MAHGRPSRSTIRELLPNSDIDREDREVERREIEDIDGVVLLPGAQNLLNSLPPDRWTIATSCTRRLAEVRLRVAGLPIPATMITSSDVKIASPTRTLPEGCGQARLRRLRLHRGRRRASGSARGQGRWRPSDRTPHDHAPSRPRRPPAPIGLYKTVLTSPHRAMATDSC